MKTVIYKRLGDYYTTNEENYNARIQNARAIHKMQGFKSPQEIIEYYCTYCGSKPEDFIVVEENELYADLLMEQQEQM